MYMLHRIPELPKPEEEQRLLPYIHEYFKTNFDHVPKDLLIQSMVSQLVNGCYYVVRVSFANKLWDILMYHSPIFYGFDIIALKHRETTEKSYPNFF